jgi:multidrug efflux pump subunit AcrB
MKLSHFFIERPIFAIVISVVTVLLGTIAFTVLPVAQYPEIAPPTVVVQAQYPGADPQTLAATVAEPIEQQVNGVENMLYMSSVSAMDGTMQLTVTFKLGTDPNIAQVLVQNRVAIAEPQLPLEVRNIGVTTQKQSPDILMAIGLTSKNNTYSPLYLSNYAYTQIEDTLKRIEGVGNVQLFGAQPYSMRIWLNPDLMYSRGLTPDDIVQAIQAQNVQVAPGSIGAEPARPKTEFQLILSTKGRLITPEQFSKIVLKRGSNGQLVYLGDVARVELGAQSYTSTTYQDGTIPAVALGIFQLPGSNELKTAALVKKAMAEMAKSFPPGIEYSIPYDPTRFTQQSIDAVYDTLRSAIILVVIVVMVFLQSWRIAVIPLIAVPVSLIGTLAVMAPMGFSLNSLSLFGLVLAIGIVVDDAIVVIENVERWIEHGLSPKEAARNAMDEVGGAIISIAVVLTAVFVPTAMVSGISGQFYRQFALTIAIATLISAFNSLTLSPALAAILIKPGHAKKDLLTRLIDILLGWFFRLFNQVNVQADTAFRADQDQIQRMYTRNSTGGMVPLGSLMRVERINAPDAVGHYNVYPAALIQGATLPGVSSGQAIEKMERICRENLPAQFAFEWTQLTYQEVTEGNTAIFIFPLCVLFVFLALAAQYESWSLPLAVILIVPMCLFSAMTGVYLRAQDNNIFTQIGFVVLVGLACKNAILIVEFARQQMQSGQGRIEAAAEAARLRLRPILMTSFAFILGVLPLVIAKGAGAEMDQALGTAVFAGMIGVTFFGVFFTPVFFSIVMKIFGRKPKGQADTRHRKNNILDPEESDETLVGKPE